MKVSAGGYVRWAETYVGPAGHDAATSIARDSRGNILVSGTSRSAAGDDDCVTLCFDRTSGARAWPGEARFARPGNEADPRVLADPRGGLFVALESDLNAGAGDDVVLLRYDGNGTRRWARRYDGPDHRPEDVSGAAVDAAGNVYIAGRSERAAGPQYSALAMRYTRGGTRRWVKLYRDFAGGREASFYDVTVDSRRRPYFAGVVGSGAAENALLRAYAPTGKVRWRDEYDSPFANQDAFYRVEAWRSSAVYALGGCLAGVGPPFDLRGLVIRYRP
jgi:outer membrane protein assembly factor BamB